MKEPQLVLPTFTAPRVKILLGWKAKGFYQRRLHLLTLILLDTGCRISEATGIHVQEVDLDNLLLTVKGGQQAAQGAVLFRATQGVVPPHAGVLSTALHAATRHLAGAIRRWFIVDRIARHFFASRSPNLSGFFLKRLSRLCIMFSLGLRSVTKAWLVPG